MAPLRLIKSHMIFSLLFFSLAVASPPADNCYVFCLLSLGASDCSGGTYCKENRVCHGLHWTSSERRRICMFGVTPDCTDNHPVACSEARELYSAPRGMIPGSDHTLGFPFPLHPRSSLPPGIWGPFGGPIAVNRTWNARRVGQQMARAGLLLAGLSGLALAGSNPGAPFMDAEHATMNATNGPMPDFLGFPTPADLSNFPGSSTAVLDRLREASDRMRELHERLLNNLTRMMNLTAGGNTTLNFTNLHNRTRPVLGNRTRARPVPPPCPVS